MSRRLRAAGLVCSVAAALALTAAAALGEPSQAAPSLTVSRTIIVYGNRVTLSGTSPDGREQVVTLVARRLGGPFSAIAQLMPDRVTGGYRFAFSPAFGTTVRAEREGVSSPPVTISVRPLVTLSVRRGLFLARVIGARSFQGRSVYLQRRSKRGVWLSVRRATVRRQPLTFAASLPEGASVIRIYLPRRQAGSGYLAGFSRPLRVRR